VSGPFGCRRWHQLDAGQPVLQVVEQRYEHGSMILTSNLTFGGTARSPATECLPWRCWIAFSTTSLSLTSNGRASGLRTSVGGLIAIRVRSAKHLRKRAPLRLSLSCDALQFFHAPLRTWRDEGPFSVPIGLAGAGASRRLTTHRWPRSSSRIVIAEHAARPRPLAFHFHRCFQRPARVSSPRSASESSSSSSELAAPNRPRAGRSSATTSSRSVTNTIPPLRTSRRYSDNFVLSCLMPTDFRASW